MIYLHSEKEAFAKERYIIRVVGRADKGLGPLLNKTNGGDGFSGFIRTEEHQNKIADANRGQTRTDEQKQRMSVSQIIYCSDEKVREMKSGISLEYYSSEEGEQTKQQISANLVSFYDTEEGQALKDHLSSINTGENNPLYGTKNSVETIEKRAATRKKNGHWQISEEELFESFSKAQTKRWENPEARREQSERVKGKRWYNNGVNSGQFREDQQPGGWILGRLKGKRWYNNGKQQGQYHPDKRPDGWELGRLR